MADLDVQRKQQKSLLPWILLGLGLLALIFFLVRGCDADDTTAAATTIDSTRGDVAATGPVAPASWDDVDFNGPVAAYDEVTDKDISVRGNERYGVYGLGENILFDEGKSTLRPDAQKSLQQVASSIARRYTGGDVRVYGHTDASGGAGANKELAEKRAEAVQAWLTENGNIGKDNISLHPIGEGQPVATNSTEDGRQQNRRVEVVARSRQ